MIMHRSVFATDQNFRFVTFTFFRSTNDVSCDVIFLSIFFNIFLNRGECLDYFRRFKVLQYLSSLKSVTSFIEDPLFVFYSKSLCGNQKLLKCRICCIFQLATNALKKLSYILRAKNSEKTLAHSNFGKVQKRECPSGGLALLLPVC